MGLIVMIIPALTSRECVREGVARTGGIRGRGREGHLHAGMTEVPQGV